MTDLFGSTPSIPARLGVTATLVDGEVQMQLRPQAEVLQHGAVRASVLSFMIDAAAGIILDEDPEAWTLTSDMTVRMRPTPAPAFLQTVTTILRRGRRSASAGVEVVTDKGEPMASGAIGFVRVPRRETDPPKPSVSLLRISGLFDGSNVLTRPLREEAGIAVVDPMNGVVEVSVTPQLRNPAGTLQGAMVALVAETAAEEMVAAQFGIDAVVIDLDLRYLAQTGDGPVRTSCRMLGHGPDAPIRVELVDLSKDQLTTLVYARAATISG
jgi:acyl-coenzyme A thioesterase PaaI-like protein